MRIRLIENVGFMLAGSCPDLPQKQAEALIRQNKAVSLSGSHIKDIKEPKKDKMVRVSKTKGRTTASKKSRGEDMEKRQCQ